jgi:type IV pilus assembly protein PilP
MSRGSVFPILFIMAILYGCEGGSASAPAPKEAAPTKIAAPKPINPAPAAATEAAEEAAPAKFTYEAKGRRDPFAPLLTIKNPIVPESDEPLTPLQHFDLSQFRLIGVITGKGAPLAMIVAPDGKSYILKKGVKLGKNNGIVIEVRREAVLVEERFYDFTGEVRTNIQEIQLPPREGV